MKNYLLPAGYQSNNKEFFTRHLPVITQIPPQIKQIPNNSKVADLPVEPRGGQSTVPISHCRNAWRSMDVSYEGYVYIGHSGSPAKAHAGQGMGNMGETTQGMPSA